MDGQKPKIYKFLLRFSNRGLQKAGIDTRDLIAIFERLTCKSDICEWFAIQEIGKKTGEHYHGCVLFYGGIQECKDFFKERLQSTLLHYFYERKEISTLKRSPMSVLISEFQSSSHAIKYSRYMHKDAWDFDSRGGEIIGCISGYNEFVNAIYD